MPQDWIFSVVLFLDALYAVTRHPVQGRDDRGMNYTHLFDIKWDDSYNDPDYRIPGTFLEWLNSRSEKDVERLAENLEFLAKALRNRTAPFEAAQQ